MTRRASTPGPGRDFRAVAADRPRRAAGTPSPAVPDHALEDDPDAVVIRARRRDDGSRYVLLHGSVVLTRALDVRAVAARLAAAADALEADAAGDGGSS